MTLPAWWTVATPRKEICDGIFSESSFAADLAEVVKNNAPLEYLDARLFFEKTYLTSGLQNLIRNVLNRIINGLGDAVIQLQTPFGGGKTHSLLAIYHLIKSFNKINHLPQIQSLTNQGQIQELNSKIAVFVGTEADVIHGKTPWGEIAEQLGCYELVKDHDLRRIAPGKEVLRKMLAESGSVVILIDELLDYIIRANRYEKQEKITQGQTLVFLQQLTEVMASSPNSLVILTLIKSDLEQVDETATKTLAQLEKIAGRLESIYVPVDGVEIYEVVRKRLFENLGDINQPKIVAQTYFSLYQQLGNDVPSEVKQISYRDKIEQAYPFHPEIIDTLYERWGSFPKFQRTRGVLRLLAEVIKDTYKKGNNPLIQSSQINLNNQTLKRELINHIGGEFDSIITSDIVGKAHQIDQQMGSEYEKYNIASQLATAVFFYSFSGSDRRGVSLTYLRIALLNDLIPPMMIGEAIGKLSDNLWYFHAENSIYTFKNEPNLNRVIIDKEQSINDSLIENKLLELLKKQPKSKLLETHFWKEAGELPDKAKFQLVILDPNYKIGDDDTNNYVQEVLNPQSFRTYKNTVFLVVIDASNYISLENLLKRYLALEAINQDEDLKKTLSTTSKTDLQTKLKDTEKQLPSSIVTAYRHVAWCGQDFQDLGTPTSGQDTSVMQRVEDYLKQNRSILATIKPELILRGLSHNENEKSLEDIYTNFLKTPGQKPMPENENVLLEAVKQGVKNGVFGIRSNDQLYYQETVDELTLSATLVRAEIAKEEHLQTINQPESLTKEEPNNKLDSYGTKLPQTGTANTPTTPYITTPQTEVTKQAKVKKVNFKAKVDFNKLSNLVRGVFVPLKTGESNITITIEVSAESKQGYDRTTLDSKVKETLKQLDSEIIDWSELSESDL